MRNSSLVECLCAEDLPGLSEIPKLRILDLSKVVEERSIWGEAVLKRAVDCMEVSMPVYVTIICENHIHHLTKVSRGRVVLPGLVGT